LISDRAALAAAAAINTAMPWQKALTLHPRNWTPREAYATRADPCLNGLAGDGCDSGGKPLTRIPIDPDTIRALAAVLVETGLTEIEIAEKDSRIRVVRAAPQGAVAAAPMALAPAAAAVIAPAADEAAHPGAVVSPMVGVAYLSPEPGSPPFITVGQSVVAGQTLLLIEAMKTFNQIRAPKAGTVARILIANSTPVEYGEVLLILE
jgi:acetyl-CoA carboxylase biotin carboxyl carrier protein